jgi:hypothetical protein
MKYEKPEVVRLGPAIDAVRSSMNKGSPVFDYDHILASTAAYEADE